MSKEKHAKDENPENFIDEETLARGPLSFIPGLGTLEITEDCEFVLLFSDGLYEKATNDEIMGSARETLLRTRDVQFTADDVVEKCIQADNTSLVLVVLKP